MRPSILSAVMLLVPIATACSLFEPAPAPPPPSLCLATKPVVPDFLLWAARRRYDAARDAEDSEAGRSAYRRVCAEDAIERDLVIDELHHHAQAHLEAWRTWYAAHCPGTVATIDPGTGIASEGYVCEDDPDAGPPPPKLYPRDPDEILAQKRREACERAAAE